MVPATRRDLAIIVPTFNERDDIVPLLEKIDDARWSAAWVVIFADDVSADGNTSVFHKICRSDLSVRMLRRIGKRGLSSAVAKGVLSTSTSAMLPSDARSALMDVDNKGVAHLEPRIMGSCKVHP